MRLTLYTDYSLRVLLYLGVRHPESSSVLQISQGYGISRNHLVKVVNQLAHLGFIETTRGRGGGLRLARDAEEISVGELVRRTEKLHLVECFEPESDTCPLTPACGLRHVLSEAAEAFLAVLDRYTLADLIRQPKRMAQLLSISPPAALSRKKT